MIEVVVCSGKPKHEIEILRAACEWVRSIADDPKEWASPWDQNLVDAVREAYPNIRCHWLMP